MKKVVICFVIVLGFCASSVVALDTPFPDGYADMATFRPAVGTPPAGGCWIYHNDREGSYDANAFTFDGYWGSTSPDVNDIPLIGDWNGDGLADYARYRHGNGSPDQIYVYLNEDWYWTYSGRWLNGTIMESTDYLIAGDWNGDGYTDFLVYRPDATSPFFGGNWLYLNNKAGGFGYWAYGGRFSVQQGDYVFSGKYNGNRFTDIWIARTGNGIVGHPNQYDQIYIWTNNGVDGSGNWLGWNYSGRLANGNLWDPGDGLQAADVDGDGRADLIITKNGTYTGDPNAENYYDRVVVYLNTTSGLVYDGVWYKNTLNPPWMAGDYVFFADFVGLEGFTSTCGDGLHPYPAGDLNHDCRVDFKDFAIMAENWLGCTSPAAPCNYKP